MLLFNLCLARTYLRVSKVFVGLLKWALTWNIIIIIIIMQVDEKNSHHFFKPTSKVEFGSEHDQIGDARNGRGWWHTGVHGAEHRIYWLVGWSVEYLGQEMIPWQRWCFVWAGDLLEFCCLPCPSPPPNNQTNIQQSQVQRPQEILATLMSGNSIAIVALPGALYPYYQVWGPFWPRHLSQTHLDLYQKLCGKIIEPYTVEPHRPQLNLTMHLTTLDIYNRYGLKMNHMMIGKGTVTLLKHGTGYPY